MILPLCLLLADIAPPPQAPIIFRYDKINVLGHTYISFTSQSFGSSPQLIHDPDCVCSKVHEQQLLKLIEEFIKLRMEKEKENQ